MRDQAERDARARLGESGWTEAYATGRQAFIDSAHDLYRFVTDAGPASR
jgi:hypothetical protein